MKLIKGIKSMSTKAKRAQVKDLVQGKTIYWVHSLQGSSFIKKMMIVQLKDEWLKVRSYNRFADQMMENTHSIKDMGIIPNHYNQHKTFTTLKAATHYLNECLK
jgi:hypothetical protein